MSGQPQTVSSVRRVRWPGRVRRRWRAACAARGIGGDVVLAAAQILHGRMTRSEDPRRAVAFQAAHRPQLGLQPPMICLDRISGVALHGMQGRGDQFIGHPRVNGARSVVTSAGTVPTRSARVKKRRTVARSCRADRKTSMTWSCWSMARYSYAHRLGTLR
jgi:hypothetical protein